MLRHDFKSANVNENCGNYSVFFEICERLPRRVAMKSCHEGTKAERNTKCELFCHECTKKHEGGFVSSLMFFER